MVKKKNSLTVMNQLDNQIIKISNVMARKTPKSKNDEMMSLKEQKMFYLCLSRANTIDDEGIVRLLKTDIYNTFSAYDNDKYDRYKEYIKEMQHKTYYQFTSVEGEWVSGFLIPKVVETKKYYKVYFDREYIPLLRSTTRYTSMFFDDIMRFECKFTAHLYQYIRSYNEHPEYSNSIDLSTMQLKDIFGLSKESYMRKNGEGFDRSNFEKHVLDKAINEINDKSKLIKNIKRSKVHKGIRVSYYTLTYELVDINEVIEIPETNECEDQLKSAELDYVINEVTKLFLIVKPKHIKYVISQLTPTERKQLLSKDSIHLFQFLKESAKSIEFGNDPKINVEGYLYTTIKNKLQYEKSMIAEDNNN